MKYDNSTRELILGVGKCYCGDGRQYARLTCDVCKGTGNGPKGGKRGCKHCNGFGSRVHKGITVDCDTCGGTALKADNWYTYVPTSAIMALIERVEVVRYGVDNMWTSNHNDVPQIISVQDYGNMWALTDDEIATDVRDRVLTLQIQACHIVQETYNEREYKSKLKIADGILVEVAQYGYVVKPLFIGRQEDGGMKWLA